MSDEAIQSKLDKLDMVTQRLDNLAETLEIAIGNLIVMNDILAEEPDYEEDEPEEPDEEPQDIRGKT